VFHGVCEPKQLIQVPLTEEKSIGRWDFTDSAPLSA
jgi:hypothetical protein